MRPNGEGTAETGASAAEEARNAKPRRRVIPTSFDSLTAGSRERERGVFRRSSKYPSARVGMNQALSRVSVSLVANPPIAT
jgi:hypothetical protein